MKVLNKITSIFLIAIFLLSSLGFTINKMVCLKSGKEKISFVNLKDCCPEKKSNTPIVKSICCDIQNSNFKLNEYNSSQKNELPSSKELVLLSYSTESVIESTTIEISKLFFADLPPPLYGKKLLHFISTLLI